jgi:glycosyltransferase involved in cell wall biosynthesis
MISFVLPAHDEAALLADTLRALGRAADAVGRRYEVVVVDDASTDATADIAHMHGARVVRIEARHIAAARNAGADAAHGDALVFIDADTRIDASVLSAALAALQGGAVGGGATVRLQSGRWHERLAAALLAPLFRLARIAPGCFLFCRRDAFDAVGGFDTRWYAGEDVAISRALGRHGRFVILRERVRTSGRKLRTHPLSEHLRLLLRFAWRGRGMLRSREALDLWYGPRR